MEVSEQVIKVLDAVCDKFGIAIDWTNNNIIPYIQQLGNKIITYDICMSIIRLVIGCVLPLTVAIFIKKFLNQKKLEAKENKTINDYYYTDGSLDEGGWWCYAMIIVLIIIAIILTTSNIQDIIQDVVFPEKTIIEFITQYTK